MSIAFYGSSLLSSYWNGAATYYRGLLRALAALGHEITFFEPDVHDRQSNRDIELPEWCRVCVYQATDASLRRVVGLASRAEVVVKASGVGYQDDALLAGVLSAASPGAVRIFMDVDAPATLATVAADPAHPLRQALPSIDLVVTYGGGEPPPTGSWVRAVACRSTMRSIRIPTIRRRRTPGSPAISDSSETASPTARRGSPTSSSVRLSPTGVSIPPRGFGVVCGRGAHERPGSWTCTDG